MHATKARLTMPKIRSFPQAPVMPISSSLRIRENSGMPTTIPFRLFRGSPAGLACWRRRSGEPPSERPTSQITRQLNHCKLLNCLFLRSFYETDSRNGRSIARPVEGRLSNSIAQSESKSMQYSIQKEDAHRLRNGTEARFAGGRASDPVTRWPPRFPDAENRFRPLRLIRRMTLLEDVLRPFPQTEFRLRLSCNPAMTRADDSRGFARGWRNPQIPCMIDDKSGLRNGIRNDFAPIGTFERTARPPVRKVPLNPCGACSWKIGRSYCDREIAHGLSSVPRECRYAGTGRSDANESRHKTLRSEALGSIYRTDSGHGGRRSQAGRCGGRKRTARLSIPSRSRYM